MKQARVPSILFCSKAHKEVVASSDPRCCDTLKAWSNPWEMVGSCSIVMGFMFHGFILDLDQNWRMDPQTFFMLTI